MGRGRPVSQERHEAARRALLDAARECLKTKSYSEISLREIAAMADQNSAMVSYYFGSKESLFIELLHEGIGAANSDLIRDLTPPPEMDLETALKNIIRQYISLHRSSPWLSRFIVDNIILKKGSLRNLFVTKILAISGERIRNLFLALQRSGAIGEKWNPDFCRISLISLLAFPFVASPVLKDAFEFDIHEVDADLWIEHTVAVLLSGLA